MNPHAIDAWGVRNLIPHSVVPVAPVAVDELPGAGERALPTRRSGAPPALRSRRAQSEHAGPANKHDMRRRRRDAMTFGTFPDAALDAKSARCSFGSASRINLDSTQSYMAARASEPSPTSCSFSKYS